MGSSSGGEAPEVQQAESERIGLAGVLRVLAGSWTVCIGLVLAPPASATDRVYWANPGNSTISFADLNGSGGGTVNITGAALSGPFGVAIDPATGLIFWVNHAGEAISFAHLNGSGGGNLKTTGAPVGGPVGIAIDPAASVIYWANDAGSSIAFAHLDGSGGGELATPGVTVSNPRGLAIDPATGMVYWANEDGNTIAFAHLNGSGGGTLNTEHANVSGAEGLAVDPAAGVVYWANSFDSTISFAHLDGSGGGNLSTAGATPNGPQGVAVDAAAGLIYWANGTNNKIQFAHLDGSGGGELATPGVTVSAPRFPALLQAPAGAGTPVLSGTTTVGSTLTCSQGAWAPDLASEFDFLAPQGFVFGWSENGIPIPGATSSSITATSPGSYTCQVTANNEAGSTTQSSGAVTIAPAPTRTIPLAAPAISAARESTSTWREGRKLAQISRKKKPPVGTTISFSLNEQAGVSFVFNQRVSGRKLNGRCVAQTKKNRRKRRCERTVREGTLFFTGHSGRNEVVFQGRVSYSKHLTPGRYTLVITATNSGGVRSAPKSLSFSIVK